jgi:hypothetical protein
LPHFNCWKCSCLKCRIKSRFFKNRELYGSHLPKNSNLGQESFVQKSGVRIQVGEGQIFCHFSIFFFLYLFHFVHKKLKLKHRLPFLYINRLHINKIKFVQYIYNIYTMFFWLWKMIVAQQNNLYTGCLRVN